MMMRVMAGRSDRHGSPQNFPESDGPSDLRCRDRASFHRPELLLDPISGSQVEIGRLARRIQVGVDRVWFLSQGLWEMGFLERSPVWLVPHRTRSDPERNDSDRTGFVIAHALSALEQRTDTGKPGKETSEAP
jgi:hypothetical protein